MASVLHEKKLKRWRISFALRLPAGPVYRSRYARDRTEADQLRRLVEALETATRTGLAKASSIDEWIARGWLKPEEGLEVFTAWREAGGPTLRRPVDLDALRRAYEDYALQHSKAGSPFRASHKSHLALAGQVLAWLEEAHPRLDLSPADVERWLAELGRKYAPWSVYHYGTYLRLLLDRAVELGMAPSNAARAVSLSTPRTRQERRVLSAEEVAVVLEASARPPYSTIISGCLGTAVQLGLYAGLRNEEMARARWEWVDNRRRILTGQASGEEDGGERWSPKDHEARRLDVKEELVSYLQEERARQQQAGLLGPYVIVAGHARLPLRISAQSCHPFRLKVASHFG